MSDIPLRIRRLQPLRPAVLHILLVLSEGERHGYAVKQQVEQRTKGVVKMGPGTLYESIQRMVELGLIEEALQRRRRQGDQAQRRYYRLTPFGKQVLEAEVARLAEIVDYARSSLRRTKPA
ncbi:MAG: helix-turn-helix transcriptional regulator [Gemmatimonadota bacterium]|nr:MAG: helix-turn-helix transcriptional regulator [Gemmatimonadota bacterium]